jgi:hypothetical protein
MSPTQTLALTLAEVAHEKSTKDTDNFLVTVSG